MLQQVHLQDGLLTGHGAEIEFLHADDGQILFALFRDEGGFLHIDAADEGILLQAAGQAGLVLADLTFDGADGGINGREHIGGALLGAVPAP